MIGHRKPIRVLCGIIEHEGKIFLCRRAKHKHLGGHWEFPGGKLEDSESEEECLSRELYEELEMKVEVNEKFMETHYSYDKADIILVAYRCRFQSKGQKMVDHDKFEWVLPCEIKNYRLAPADVPLAMDL